MNIVCLADLNFLMFLSGMLETCMAQEGVTRDGVVVDLSWR